ADASQLGEDAVACAQRSGDDIALAIAVSERAVSTTGYEKAARHSETAIPILKRIGDESGLAIMCSVTGYQALAEHGDEDALPWLETGLAAARRSAQPFVMAHVSGNLGLAHLFAGDMPRASEAFDDTLALPPLTAADHLVGEALKGMAAVAAARGDLETAARLEGAADVNASTRVTAPTEAHVEDLLAERHLAPARARLGPDEWDRQRRAGA